VRRGKQTKPAATTSPLALLYPPSFPLSFLLFCQKHFYFYQSHSSLSSVAAAALEDGAGFEGAAAAEEEESIFLPFLGAFCLAAGAEEGTLAAKK
jgi:hypothetical protein